MAFFPLVSWAGSNPANLSVTATVVANCTITTTPVAFGNYDVLLPTDLAGTGSVIATCNKGAGLSIGLGLGLHAAGAVRKMQNAGTDVLTYELYQQVGHSTVWGTAAGSVLTLVAAPSKAAITYTVYGNVPNGQDDPAGAYSDTVVATVNF